MKITDIMLFGDAINGGNSGGGNGCASLPLIVDGAAMYFLNNSYFISNETVEIEGVNFIRVGDFVPLRVSNVESCLVDGVGVHKAIGEAVYFGFYDNATSGNVRRDAFLAYTADEELAVFGIGEGKAEELGMPEAVRGGVYLNMDVILHNRAWFLMYPIATE